MLSCYFKGIVSLGTIISTLVGINNGKDITTTISTANAEFIRQPEAFEEIKASLMDGIIYIFIPIVLVYILIIAIILASKKYPNVPQWLSKGIAAIRAIFSDSGASKGTANDELDKVIEISGYTYDSKQDIFYSNMDAWQRNMGYCYLYDEAAAPLGMIIDCEPIYFEYGGKMWMIEFWKGQYDLTTGCEIGVYTTEQPVLNIAGIFKGTFYNCVSNEERLQMSYSLKKNNEILFTREDKHWWLTGFKLGEFSHPSDLTMYINITLKDKTMRNEFVKGLKNANYTEEEITQNGNTVSLKFNETHVLQPLTRTRETDRIIQSKNKLLCNKYQYITRNCENMPEKIEAIREHAPEIYEKIMNIGKNKKLFEIYKKIENYLD